MLRNPRQKFRKDFRAAEESPSDYQIAFSESNTENPVSTDLKSLCISEENTQLISLNCNSLFNDSSSDEIHEIFGDGKVESYNLLKKINYQMVNQPESR
jgi:hypothetical protein